MTNVEKLAQLLQTVLSKETTHHLEPSFFSSLTNETLRFVRFEKGDYLTQMGLPLERILIHLDGQVSVFKYSHGGISIRGGISEAPQIYGLYEALNGIEEYSVALQAASVTHCAAVSPDFFLHAIQNNHSIALYALSFLAKFTDRMLDRNDQLALNTPYDNLLIYIFEKSVGKPFPFVISTSKNEMAELFNISNRTLYRLLEKLHQEGLLKRSHGKIVISKEAFQKIKEKYYNYRNNFEIH